MLMFPHTSSSSSCAISESPSSRSRLDSSAGIMQCRSQPLRWIKGANSLPLLLHEFSDRQLSLALGIQASFQNRPDKQLSVELATYILAGLPSR